MHQRSAANGDWGELTHVALGNSLGGPVALEAAALLPGRAIGVVGIDTFHNATAQQDPAEVIARASAFEADPLGSC